MMTDSFLPRADAAMVAWGENFSTVAGQNLATLKLTQAEVDEFAKEMTALQEAMTAAESLRAQSKGVTQKKATARGTAQSKASSLNLRIQGTPGVSDDLKARLGLTVKKPSPARVRPLTPHNLVVNGYQNGVNKLHWSRNGNGPGTLFLIECRMPDAANWTQAATTTAARFEHQNQTPGMRITYRVRAQRADSVSPPSTEAVAYGAMPPASLTLVKAA